MEQGHALPAPELAPALDALGLEFLAGFLEAELHRHPENLGALVELGHVYTRARRFEKGLEVDRELVRRCPEDATCRYNLACSLALLGRGSEAIDELERAVGLGYAEAEHMLADEDLASLRGSARFEALLRALASKKEPEGREN
jgi:tetratricopeptide (TPR) repeat protein